VQGNPRTAADIRAHARRFDAATLASLGALCSIASLLGWALDFPQVRGFGVPEFPIWPWTAVGFTGLAFGHLAIILGWKRLAAVLLLIPLLVAASAILQTTAGADLGIDRLLFGSAVSQYDALHPGRPGTNPVAVFLLLGASGYLSIGRRPRSGEVDGLIVVIAVGVAVAAAFLAFTTIPAIAMLASAIDDPATRYRSISAPSAMSSICIATAVVVHHGNVNWIRLFAVEKGIWRLVRLMLPAALLIPLLPPVFGLALLRGQLFSSVTDDLLLLLCNLLVVAIVGYWAATRIARDQASVVELSQALDKATVAVVKPDGTITHWSKGCEQLYGWTAEEATGQSKYALLRSRCQRLNHAPPTATGDVLELVELAKDGREVHVLERTHQVESPMRGPLLVLGINEVSQLVAATDALKASEERLAAATSAHELGIFEWQVETGRIDWSPGTEQRLGFERGDLSDFERLRAQIDPADMQNILETVANTVRNRADKFSFRWRLLHPKGVHAVEGSARAFYDGQGNLERCVGVILDVTERDEREGALRRREVHLQSILDTVPDAIVVINSEGTILQFSAAAEALWGHDAEDAVGRDFTMLVPAPERERHAETLQRFTRAGIQVPDRVVTGVAETKDGRRFPFEARTGAAQIDEDMLFTIFVRDLTEQAAAEERLSELNAEIAHVSRQSAMSELAADLAHELNQPLSATSNFLAAARMLTERDEDPVRIADLLRMATEQTLRAGEIIRRLRAFMARGEVEMRAELVDRTVRDAVDLVLAGTSQVNIRVSYHLDSDVRFIFADRIQVQQVLVNLLRNAMEALRQADRKDKVITIRSRHADDQMIAIEVSDNGPGMPPHVLEHLFSRFNTTKGPGGGMGIGLSISKRIIEAHGGTLTGENRPEGGACFRFTLPAGEQGVINDEDNLHR
jgi:two-component system, LuxR family, sensor kinase FixL